MKTTLYVMFCIPTPSGLSTKSDKDWMDVLGVWRSATILAEYEVNKNNDDTKNTNIVKRADIVEGDSEKPVNK